MVRMDQKILFGGFQMAKKDQIKESVKEIVKLMPEDWSGEKQEGVWNDESYEIWRLEDDKATHVIFGNKVWKVTGDKRLKVVEIVQKTKKAKEPLPARIEVACRVCGADFEVSKFNPYQNVCYDCRRDLKKAQKHINPEFDNMQECFICGSSFEASAYTPYAKFCPDCRKLSAKKRREVQMGEDKADMKEAEQEVEESNISQFKS